MSHDPVLDALFANVEKEIAKTKREKAAAKAAKPSKPKLPPGYTDIANWRPERAVALVHKREEVLTFLGNFREYFYDHLPGARQLRRILADDACVPDAVQIVEGEWWLKPQGEELARPQRWVTEHPLNLGITLKECDLHCADVPVIVHLYHQGIARVVLAEEVRFTCPTRNTFLILPKGLDVLEGMSLESKLDLRRQLDGEEEGEEEDGTE